MHKYLDRWEKKIEGTPSGKFFFNKYYNIKDLYWTILYTTTFGVLAGFGNAFPELNSGLANILYAFAQGFLNNTYLSIFINIFYARVINFWSNKKHLRLYGNILCAIVQVMFYIWHSTLGTENPFQAILLPAIAAFLLTNYHINTLKNSKI